MIARRALLLYSFKGIYAVLTLALGAAFARFWGIEAFGRFALMWTVLVAAIAIGGAGVGSYLVELLPKVSPRRYAGLFRVLSLVTLTSGTLAALLSFPLLRYLDSYSVAALAILPASLHTAFVGGLVAEGRQVASGAIDGVLRPALTLTVTLFVGRLGGDPASAITAGLVGSYVVTALVAGFMVESARVGPARNAAEPSERIPFATPLFTYVAMGALTTLLAQADRFVINQAGSLRDLASYSAAQNMSNIVIYGVNSAAVLVLPQIASHMSGRTTREQLSTSMDHLCRPLVGLSAGCAITAAVFGDKVLTLFGPDFVSGRWPLTILLVGLSASLLFGFPMSVMSMSDSRLWLIAHLAAGVALLVTLSAILLPVAGPIGVAIANATVAVVVRISIHLHCRAAGIPSYFAFRRRQPSC